MTALGNLSINRKTSVLSRLISKAVLAGVFSLFALGSFPAFAGDCADVPYDYAKDAQASPQGNVGYADYAARANRTSCTKDWTVLVYMAADNDLTPYALLNISEMEAAWSDGVFGGSTAKSDLVVELDTKLGDSRKRLQIFQTDQPYHPLTKTELAARTELDIRSPIVQSLPKQGGANEEARFRDFLLWATQNYPSKHYAVIAWGHGQGWTSRDAGNLNQWGGLAFDGAASDGSKLDIPALRRSLEATAKQIGHPVDVYASDACLMQMVEVATEISHSASYIVGSDTIQSYVGLPYRQIMREVNSGKFGEVAQAGESADASEPLWFSRMVPKLYKDSMAQASDVADDGGAIDSQAIHYLTSSAIESKSLRERLVPSLAVLGESVSKYIAEDPLRAMDLRYVARSAVEFEGDAQDLGVFLELVRQSLETDKSHTANAFTPAAAELAESVETAARELENTVVGYAVGSKYLAASPSGIPAGSVRAVSLWIPVSDADFAGRYNDFASSIFYRYGFHWGDHHDGVPGWQSWLAKIYTAAPADAMASTDVTSGAGGS